MLEHGNNIIMFVFQMLEHQFALMCARHDICLLDTLNVCPLVVITFSKADAERLRLIIREFRLTSD